MISKGTIMHVGSPTEETARGGRTYMTLDVVFKDDQGQVRTKALRSFANPGLFKEVQKFKEGDTFYVETNKDEKGYWQWSKISSEPMQDNSPAPAAAGGGGGGASKAQYSRDFETAQERGRKQVIIVRQSSISNAIDYCKAQYDTTGEGELDTSTVLEIAEKFEGWVMRDWKVNSDDTLERV